MTTDEKIAGGGRPNGSPPPPTPVRQPQPEPPKPATPEPQVKETKPDDKDSDSLEPTKKPKVKVNLTKVTRKPTTQTAKPNATKTPSADQTPSKDLQALKSTVNNLKSGLSTATTVDSFQGPGGDGVPYANFYDGVKKIYSDAWLVPDGVTDDNATVTASVTIARNGEVTASKIVVSSGNSEVDQSVQATLNRVRFAVPLPTGAKEDERTVRIKFNVRAQRLLG
jgi:TonB family protein